MLNQIFDYLYAELDSISKNHQTFGYKERMQIERGLFLLLKLLCDNKLRYNLQGFSKAHKDSILTLSQANKCNAAFTQLIEQVFQLKVFIQSLSSENAYVRGDALSRLGLNRQTVLSFISDEVQRLRHKTDAMNIEHDNQPDRV